ncbi:Dynamin family protein [Plenodomus tracheiphilus IPT5]|uniref:Dynamin family protein n=1 Tax=Plenodomus tracheiphilus IPT5 TaxID=1408161 RepID=A0A6A7AN52_9PLEO|nr:Dynamin family protein [Plenodomus tracheiphilus IPT5]
MALSPKNASGLIRLQVSGSSKRLNQIDRIRARGVGDHISLPQLVVCGDQSAGKSSVLEGITGVPFPRQDGVCTRFATEIVLRHCPGQNEIIAKILPSASRTEEQRLQMTSFERKLSGFDDLPRVIQEVSVLMGIKGSADTDVESTTFAADVLRLEVIGDTGLHLTVVDLPGLISVSENVEDMHTVERLVDSYLESTRTIILAVVPASNDIDTQGIIQRARRFDKAGVRTVGIITKPDLINKGTESRVTSLAKNLDRVKLKLGFFLLKNPSPLEMSTGLTWEERQRQEAHFFNSSPWKEQNLDKSRVGIDNLRNFLQGLLDNHIELELPKVRKEVESLLQTTESELAQIGPERTSTGQIRMYLTHTSMEFFNLTKAAVDGCYGGRDAVFFATGPKKNNRLRAQIHMANEEFATYMRAKAAKRRFLPDDQNEASSGSEQTETSDRSENSDESSSNEQLRATKKQTMAWVKKIYLNSRGRELPGSYNHVVLSELFHEQCSRWGNVARDHLATVFSIVDKFVSAVVDHIIADDQVRNAVTRRVRKALDTSLRKAQKELCNILSDEQAHPITYNHYYTDNIHKAREDASRQGLQASMDHAVANEWNGKMHVSNTPMDLTRLCTSLKSRVVVDMTEQACEESLAALKAYYKVAMKTFVDNVCRQVIERHLLSDLVTAFDPVCVGMLSDDELLQIAAESQYVRARRNDLQAMKKAFEESLQELRD